MLRLLRVTHQTLISDCLLSHQPRLHSSNLLPNVIEFLMLFVQSPGSAAAAAAPSGKEAASPFFPAILQVQSVVCWPHMLYRLAATMHA